MTVTGTEVKIGVDLLARLFGALKELVETRKEKNLLSRLYKELLLGDAADLVKVEAMLLQLRQLGSSSAEFLRAEEYLASAKKVAKKVAKKPAAKKVAAGKAVVGAKAPGKRKTAKQVAAARK